MSLPDPHALAAAIAIAERLTDPSTIPMSEGSRRRAPQSLANGAAGIALLHIERAQAGQGDWTTAHAWLSAAVSDDLSAGPNASLFFGVPTLAFVTYAAVDRPGKHERALADLHTATTALTCTRLDHAHARIDRGDRPTLAEFDLIRGLTGLGAYYLQRDPHQEMTVAVLAYLVRLTEPLYRRTDGLPGWWTDLDPTGQTTPDYPAGHGNFGMAHGIAGPLALLSLALRRGVVVDGHTDAITRICTWLDTWRQDHPAGPWWPRTITPEEVNAQRIRQPSPLQPSWCYGTPGLARAQQLAGLALGDIQRQQAAEAALLGCLTDPTQLARIIDSGLCHGFAGLLHTAWRMATDAATSDIAAPLALHTAATDTAPLSHWDACLHLS